jgi:hypothetical protein
MCDYLHPFTFVAAVSLPVVYFATVWRRWPKIGMLSLAVYLVIYALLTLSGAYTVANHGGSDWRREWLPKFLVVECMAPSGRTRTTTTFVGAMYWPCIFVDQLLWHHTTADDVLGTPDPSVQRAGAASGVSGVSRSCRAPV